MSNIATKSSTVLESQTPEYWGALAVTIPQALEEIITAVFWEAETGGIVTTAETADTITLTAYFPTPPDADQWRQHLTDLLPAIGYLATDLIDLQVSLVPNEDWLLRWKESYIPFTVGERLLITPSWRREEVSTTSERLIIEIDPGMAFGTGTHETTQLCLRALERYWQGTTLLDVGTGTAILAMAAAKLVPSSQITACDNDAEAVTVAAENIAINQLGGQITLLVGTAANLSGNQYDCLVANLTADVIVAILADLLAVVRPQGYLVLSGILATQQEWVTTALSQCAETSLEIAQAGEWIAIVVCKA
jgi:ribosomal protein L11 methyltransferase